MDPDQTTPPPHCLPVCKNRFEKFARIFSRRHKQTTFSDAGFLGLLRVSLYQSPLPVSFTSLNRRQIADIFIFYQKKEFDISMSKLFSGKNKKKYFNMSSVENLSQSAKR